MKSLDLNELKEDYIKLRQTGNATQYELAQAEGLLWQHYCRIFGDDHGTNQRYWLTKNVALDTQATYENRATLYHQRSWTLPLFDKVDAKAMTLATATRLTRTVKAYAKEHKVSRADALIKFLEGFDGTAESLRAVSADTPISQLEKHVTKASQAFKQQVLALSAGFIELILQGMPDAAYHKHTLMESFSTSQGQLIEELRFSIRKIKTQERAVLADEVSDPTSFEWACEVLGLTDAEFGKDIDIIRASRAKFRRARELHPDRNPAPEAVEEYQAVIEAFKILEHYHSKRKKD